MAVRNSHARHESLVTRVTLDGKKYSVYSANWQVDRAKRYYVANKLKQGKLDIPSNAQEYYGYTILYATLDNKLSATEDK
jgi:hypothetical protein